MIVAWAGYRGARVRAWECRKSYKDGDDIGAIAVAGTWVSIRAVRVVAVACVSCVEVAALGPCLGEVDRCSADIIKEQSWRSGLRRSRRKVALNTRMCITLAEQHVRCAPERLNGRHGMALAINFAASNLFDS
jgi:hypothetical protein